ncbi:hypothetical protein [Leptolyngbya ohadii]|uniref:hypothetical protein n=1 Tax=Leptolyngbya ohadii TaxID=1962290 RepID=UPI000B598770|nr:hypothetical protein [Leptolyngbya ohadii]
MASPEQVKQYLAYWFQLGKPLILDGKNTEDGRSKVLPQSVIQGDRYSPEFEACWQQISSGAWKSSYLEGTVQTVEHLLSSQWEISSCARCAMPVPMLSLGLQTGDSECPCADLPGWPNTELPQPRVPVDSRNRLQNIRDRLSQH